jgi:hypothetical protein
MGTGMGVHAAVEQRRTWGVGKVLVSLPHEGIILLTYYL